MAEIDDWISPPQPAAALAPAPNDFSDIPTPSGRQPLRLTITPNMPEADIGPVGAAATGAMQGATFNFGDELAGLAAAGRAGAKPPQSLLGGKPPPAVEPEHNAFDTLVGLARLGYETATGGGQPKGEATTAYEEARDRWRATVERAKQQQPSAYLGGNIAGSLIGPTGIAAAPVRAAGAVVPRLLSRPGLRELGTRMIRGGEAGAITGGLSGAGEGEDLTSRAKQGAIGAGVGAAVGTVAPVVVEPIVQAVQPVARAIGSQVKAVFAPTAEAERRMIAARAADVATDPAARNRVAAAEARIAHGQGEPVMQMDVGGETTRALANSAANTSPQARQVLTQPLMQRSQEAPVRYSDRLQQMLTYTPQQRERAIREVADQVYEPRYAQAWKDSANIQLWPDSRLPGPKSQWRGAQQQTPQERALLTDLADLVAAPEVQSAIRVANPQLRNWAIADGLRPPTPAFRIEDGKVVLTENKNSVNLPSLQYWDYIKRALDQAGTPTSRQFARVIRNDLDQLVPSYQTARETASHIKFFEGAPNAYEAGQEFVNRGVQFGPEARARLAAMDPREQNLFRDGYLKSVVDRIEKTGRLDAINRIQRSRGAQDEMNAALGPNGFREVESMARLHDLMERAKSEVTGNSKTARRLIELGLVSGAGGYGLFTGDPHAIAAATIVGGRRAVNERMARRIADLLVEDNPASFASAAQLLSKDQRMLDRLRALGTRLATRLAPQATPSAKERVD